MSVAPVRFVLRLKTKNPLNVRVANSRSAAMAIRRRDRVERDTSRAETIRALRLARVTPCDLLPARVLLTRFSSGRLDPHDGLPASFKRIVDGIALALCVDDGGPAVQWRYRQGKCKPGLFGLVVTIERRT